MHDMTYIFICTSCSNFHCQRLLQTRPLRTPRNLKRLKIPSGATNWQCRIGLVLGFWVFTESKGQRRLDSSHAKNVYHKSWTRGNPPSKPPVKTRKKGSPLTSRRNHFDSSTTLQKKRCFFKLEIHFGMKQGTKVIQSARTRKRWNAASKLLDTPCF